VVDDGHGIDAKKIADKALEKGIASEAQLARMSESAILELIFAPGFSSAEEVTEISGRGVGMDVVKTSIEELGGTVEVQTTPDHGTTFRLRVPLSLELAA